MIYFCIISFIILGLYYNYYIKPRNYIPRWCLIIDVILVYILLVAVFLAIKYLSMSIYHELYPCEDCKYNKRIESYYDKNMELKTNVTYVWDHCDYVDEHFYK